MYISTSKNPINAKIEFYNEQASELLELTAQLTLASHIAGEYSYQDALYYREMQTWLQNRFDYVIPNAMSYTPSKTYGI